MAKEAKTNAMRMLDRQKVKYETLAYECDEFIDGIHCADITGAPYEQSFKTLVMEKEKRRILCICSSNRERSGPESGCQGCRREGCGYDPCERYYEDHRLCSRWLQPYWNEETFSHGF